MEFMISAVLVMAYLASFILWQRNVRQRPEFYLWLFMITLAFHLTLKFIYFKVIPNEGIFTQFSTPTSLLYPPLIFMYVLKSCRRELWKWRQRILHYLPFIMFAVLYAIVGVKIFYLGDSSWLKPYNISIRVFTILSNLIYLPIVLHLIRKYQHEVHHISWVRIPVWIWLTIVLPNLFFNLITSYVSYYLIFITSGISIILMIAIFLKSRNNVKGLGFSVAVEQARSEDPSSDFGKDPKIIESKYQKSSLSEQQARNYIEVMQQLMEKDKLYMDEDLTLDTLARSVGAPKHHITEALNQHLHKNFFQFINGYRIAAAKKQMILNPKETRLLFLASSCGFKSKTTFIKYFKEIEGCTPSCFLKQVQASSQPDLIGRAIET